MADASDVLAWGMIKHWEVSLFEAARGGIGTHPRAPPLLSCILKLMIKVEPGQAASVTVGTCPSAAQAAAEEPTLFGRVAELGDGIVVLHEMQVVTWISINFKQVV